MPKESRNRTELGRTNRRAVLSEVVLKGPLHRTNIAHSTGLTSAAVSRITRDLIEAGLLIELRDEMEPLRQISKGPGRKFVRLDVNPLGGYVLGIGVNVFSQSVTLADLKNRRIVRHDLKLGDLTDPDSVIESLVQETNNIVAKHVPDRRRLLGASFAFTGAVDPLEGIVRTSPYLRWGEVVLGERLSRALSTPVHIESLPAALALAESKFGIARGIREILVVNCSLGIGAAIVMNGSLARGYGFSAGLIGDITPPGKLEGTLDTLGGGHGILLRLHGNDLNIPEIPANRLAEMLLEALATSKTGDLVATQAFAEAGRVLGETLTPFLGLLHPESIMIAGPLAMAPQFVAACRQALGGTLDSLPRGLLVSGLSAQAAARWVAIDEFLLQRDLNLDGLKLSKAA